MKNTSTEEQKEAMKATRATAEPEVDNADCSEDLIAATQPEETRGIKGWRKQSIDDIGAKNKNDETMTTKVKESNNRCKQMTKRQSAKPPLNQESRLLRQLLPETRKNEEREMC